MIALTLAACWLAVVIAMLIGLGPTPYDARTYYLTAERLASAGSVYTLRPDDPRPPLGGDDPEYGLYSPPLIAALLRPMAFVPEPVAEGTWWALMAAIEMIALAVILTGRPVAGGLMVVLASPGVGITIGSGNVDAVILLGGIVAWLLIDRGSDRAGGITLGVLAALKATPALLLLWLLLIRRWRALTWAVAAAGATLVFTVLATYPGVIAEYLQVLRDLSTAAPTSAGIAALLRGSGLSPELAAWGPWLVLAGFLIVAFSVRSRPGLSFAAVVMAMVFGTPAGGFHTFALLLLALAPWLRADGAGAWGKPVIPYLPFAEPQQPGATRERSRWLGWRPAGGRSSRLP